VSVTTHVTVTADVRTVRFDCEGKLHRLAIPVERTDAYNELLRLGRSSHGRRAARYSVHERSEVCVGGFVRSVQQCVQREVVYRLLQPAGRPDPARGSPGVLLNPWIWSNARFNHLKPTGAVRTTRVGSPHFDLVWGEQQKAQTSGGGNGAIAVVRETKTVSGGGAE